MREDVREIDKKRLRAIVGMRIRNLRERFLDTQGYLAEAIGMSRASINNYENGHTPMPLHRLMQIAARYKVPVETLIPEWEEL